MVLKTFLISYLVGMGVTLAQNVGGASESITLFDEGLDGSGSLTAISYKETVPLTVGDVYLFENWDQKGELYYENKKKYIVKGLNYKINSDVFQIKLGKDSVYTLHSNRIDSVKIKNEVFKKFKNSMGLERFCQVLFKGNKLSLLKRHKVRMVKGVLNPLDGNVSPNEYYKYEEFYLATDKHIRSFSLKRRGILDLFDTAKRPVISNFMKKNKISPKKEIDLIEIFKFADSF